MSKDIDDDCPKCGKPSGIVPSFYNIGDKNLSCRSCGQLLSVEYDESYDEESSEEWGWFWLEARD